MWRLFAQAEQQECTGRSELDGPGLGSSPLEPNRSCTVRLPFQPTSCAHIICNINSKGFTARRLLQLTKPPVPPAAVPWAMRVYAPAPDPLFVCNLSQPSSRYLPVGVCPFGPLARNFAGARSRSDPYCAAQPGRRPSSHPHARTAPSGRADAARLAPRLGAGPTALRR